MKKSIIYLIVFLLIVLGVYLNRSYAHIYGKIDAVNLKSSNTKQMYNLGSETREKLVYVALGDSLTSGVGVSSYEQSYPYQLAQYLTEIDTKNITLYPQAIPGAKTHDVIGSLLDSTIKIQPNIITILIGVNDVHGNISKEEFENNYKTILKRLTEETNAKIYTITIPYIGAKNLILPPHDYYFDAQTQEFNQVIQKLSQQYRVENIDLYTPDLKMKGTDYYSSDLFHPSFVVYKEWGKIIYDAINQ